jgi:uncharacterized protein with HEPN domain
VEAKYEELVAENREMFFDLFNRGIAFIGEAKAIHDKMETYYAPYMDFKAIARLRQRILERILGYAQEVYGRLERLA